MTTQPANNTRDSTWVYAHAVRNLFLGLAVGEPASDGRHIIDRQFPDKGHYSKTGGMQEVVSPRDPFEVINPVVGLSQINVIDLSQALGIGNECNRHKAMDRNYLCGRVGTKHNDWVTTVTDVNFEVSTTNWPETSGFALTPAVETPDFSKVTHLVESTEFVNGDCSPLFSDSGWHVLLITHPYRAAQGESLCR